MIVKLLTEHHFELLSLKGGCTGSSVSTLVKMPHCWKSRVMAQMKMIFILFLSGKFKGKRRIVSSFTFELCNNLDGFGSNNTVNFVCFKLKKGKWRCILPDLNQLGSARLFMRKLF